jgi:hypothetical protein
MLTVTRQDLIKLGYGNSFASDIMRQAKSLMVEKGYSFYRSRKLSRVPCEAVEEILGITLPNKTSEISKNQEVIEWQKNQSKDQKTEHTISEYI